MLRKLFSILKGDYPLQIATGHFQSMLELARQMIIEADEVYWGKELTPVARTALYNQDVQLNKLQRQVRKAVITGMSGPGPGDVPYALLLMSLVKDIERLGDYAKNVAEISKMTHPDGKPAMPGDEVVGELQQVCRAVVALAREAPEVYATSNTERARELTAEGRSIAQRCDQLITRIARGHYDAGLAVNLALAARFYKRLEGHLLNLLSSMLMPLHKLDYYEDLSG